MPRIDEMPKYRASLPKHTHNLSHDFGFTCSTGQLLPVFHDYLNAGETVNLSFNYFLRTQPLQSAAMCKLRCHTEYFFVPMQLLYQPFGSFLYGITDEFSSQFSGTLMDVLPVVDIDDCINSSVYNSPARTLYKQNGVAVGDTDNALVYRLGTMFGFDLEWLRSGTVQNDHTNPNVFPYMYLAYQCIYQNYYRLDNREVFHQDYFNFDKWYATPLIDSNTVGFPDLNIFSLRYRPLQNDYFTDVKVSPIVDVLNLNNKNIFPIVNTWLTRSIASSKPVLGSGTIGLNNVALTGSPMKNNPSSDIQTQFGFVGDTTSTVPNPILNGVDISTANIRAMFANEKLWSITGRAKKHYDDQTLAHLGFEVPHDPKHEITLIGHDISDISIGEVISTANTYNSGSGTGSPLAEIAGKGYGNDKSKVHKFTAPCHGVVMVIFSVTVDRNYFEGVPKYNIMRDRNDLYQPEFDHLGMQPLFMYETADINYSRHGEIFGWQYRYEQWKRRYNRVTPAFCHSVSRTGSFYSWMNTSYANLTSDSNKANTPSFVNFLNLPTDINDIMLVSYQINLYGQSGATDYFAYDPFIVASHINCKKISTMSDYSLPRLDA